MHHKSLIKKTSLALVSILFTTLFAVSAHAAPSEVSQQTLTRTAANGLILQSKLVKNAYRQEPYQASYTVQVPYQDTETYYVDVPYEVTETYYVDVPYQDQEAYTDYETYYTSDYVCHDYTDYERQCHTVTDCDNVPHSQIQHADLGNVIGRPRDPGGDPGPAPYNPGGGGGGGGGGGYDPGPAPYPGPSNPGPRPPVCHERQVCENVPVTRQRCGYEQTQHSRAVTKYRTVTKTRSEARTRTVTKTRSEARTRPVTKYRDEDRCCVTKYNTVFDHQWSLNVQVQFPQGTELNANESESFKVVLGGTEVAPDVTVTPVSTVFGYNVVSKEVANGVVTLVLTQVARYKGDDLKEKSLQNFSAVVTPAGLMYRFFDNAIFARVTSHHQVIVQDAVTHEVVMQSDVRANSQREVSGELAVNWDFTRNYEVVLKVHREGTVIDSGVVDFAITQPLQMVLDMVALKDVTKISANAVGNTQSVQILVKDSTIPYSSVLTKYVISLVRKTATGKGVVFAAKGFSRTALVANADGFYAINIADFAISAADIASYLKSGSKLQVVVEVDRVTSDGKKIQFWQSGNTVIQ